MKRSAIRFRSSTLSPCIALAPRFANLGLNVFMIDYRGYGESGGKPSINTLMSNAETALEVVRSMSGDQPVIVHGFRFAVLSLRNLLLDGR